MPISGTSEQDKSQEALAIVTDLLSTEQRETLQEVANIAMGQTAESLAKLLGVFVHLSIPRVHFVELAEIGQALAMLAGIGNEVSVVRQAYGGGMRGEAIAIFDDASYADLAELMGYDSEISPQSGHELLLDVSNLLIGAFVTGIAGLLRTPMNFSAPSVMSKHMQLGQLMDTEQSDLRYALVVEISFTLESRKFSCHLSLLTPEATIATLRGALDRFMESF